MNEIRRVLKIAAMRLELSSLLARANLVTIAVGAAVLALLVAERLGSALFVPWVWVLPVLAALGLAAAARLWLGARRSEIDVAIEVDDRLALRERLSTALHVRDRGDAFARAAVADAVATARDPRVREQLGRRFPVAAPPRWWLSPLVLGIAAALWFVPPIDLFARDAPPDERVNEAAARSQEAVSSVVETIKESPELSEELQNALEQLAGQTVDPEAIRDRKEIQRSALKQLTDLDRALREITEGPKGKTAEALQRALDRLQAPADGPARELADALARGDFKAAQEALNKLLEQAQQGAAEREQLAAQLRDLANQMAQLAQQQQRLQELLRQAGMDPQLAANPAALQQALQNNPNLNQMQRQQLQEMVQAQQAACKVCQGLGQGLGQLAQQVAQGGQGQMAGQQAGPMGQGLQQQLNQLEAMRQMLQQAQAAAAACQGQCQGLGQGLGMQLALQQWAQQLGQGGAFGNRGQGQGGKAPIAPTPTGTKITQANAPTLPGDITFREFIDGPQITGESTRKLQQVRAAIAEAFDEAQGEMQLPQKYHRTHQHYFGELQRRTGAAPQPGEPPDKGAPAPEAKAPGN
jgi:hypothetical protein